MPIREIITDRDVYVALARPSTIDPGKWFFWVARSPYRLRVNRHSKIVAGDFNLDQRSDLLALLVPDYGEGRSCMGMRALYAQPTGVFGPPTSIRNALGGGCPSSYYWHSYRQQKVLTGDFSRRAHGSLHFGSSGGVVTRPARPVVPLTTGGYGFKLEAFGDLEGRGVWTFEQVGSEVDITYDWRIRAEKPVLRYLSFLLKPIFAANHHWAMARGEESLCLELVRRRDRAESST